MEEKFNAEVAIVYRKSDGHIARVCSLAHVTGKITENDIKLFFPHVADLSDFNMVLLKGKQYLEIDKYKIETDVEGNFVAIVEKVDVLVPFSEDQVKVDSSLLDRESEIVVSVLSVVDDPARLRKYKDLEEKGQNRPEVMNFFKERGI